MRARTRRTAALCAVFLSYTNTFDHCYDAWNNLIAQPWTIMARGLRHWAYEF
jgi:hypothetical protein